MEKESERSAIETLQELGLKEYEARTYVTLTRLGQGSATDVGTHSTVPRTRVYDAVRVLESTGLVDVQHTNPKLFRPVSIDAATETFEQKHEARLDDLRDALDDLTRIGTQTEPTEHEVWSLSDPDAIANRTRRLLDQAESEVILVLGDDRALTDGLLDALQTRADHDVHVALGTLTPVLEATAETELSDVDALDTSLDWLHGNTPNTPTLSRLLLVDGDTVLISTATDDPPTEHAIFARGPANGVVVLARRLAHTDLLPGSDTNPPT